MHGISNKTRYSGTHRLHLKIPADCTAIGCHAPLSSTPTIPTSTQTYRIPTMPHGLLSTLTSLALPTVPGVEFDKSCWVCLRHILGSARYLSSFMQAMALPTIYRLHRTQTLHCLFQTDHDSPTLCHHLFATAKSSSI